MADVPASSPAPAPSTPRWKPALVLLGVALWVGVIAGIVEVGVIAACRAGGMTVMVDLLRMNRHAPWMIPASNAAIFAVVGLALAGLSLVGPRLSRAIAGPALGTLAFGGILLRVPGLHEAARWALAFGLAMQATRLSRRLAPVSGHLFRWGLPATLIVAAVLGPIEYRRVIQSEARAIAALPAPPANAPNVLLLVMDTVRADRLSLNGYHRDTTPNLKRRAADGVMFDHARSTAPWTLPSHASMLTGRWPHQLSADEDHAMNRSHATLAEFLASRGYATAGFVANTYYCNAAFGLDRGFAHYEDCHENAEVSLVEVARSSALGLLGNRAAALAGLCMPPGAMSGKNAESINRDTMAWIERQQSRPFFAFVNYIDAHAPYLLPEGDHRRFGVRPETPEDFKTLRGWHGANKEKVTPHQVQLVSDAYDDCIAYLDAQIGRLLDDMDARGLLKNTLVIVTSDHGEHMGEHQLYGHGRSLYRQELHVPLLVLAPGLPKGKVVTAPASLRDLPATIADLAGLDADSPFPGGSLAPFWTDRNAPDRPVLTEVSHRVKTSSKKANRPPAWRGPMNSIVVGDLVYIRNADGREELYDIEADPLEVNNLVETVGAEAMLSPFRDTLVRLKADEDVREVPMMAKSDRGTVRR